MITSGKSPILWAAAFIAVAVPVAAQNSDCGELLRHGIYENFAETGLTTSYADTKREVCRAYNEYNSTSGSASAGVNYMYVFSGNLSLSAAQVKSIGESMCDLTHNVFNAEGFRQVNSSTISGAAVAAWSACVAHSQRDVFTQVDYMDTDQGTVGLTVSMTYRPVVSGSTNERIVRIDAKGLTCDGGSLSEWVGKGRIADARQPRFSSRNESIVCRRTISDKPFVSGSREVFADNADLSITTSVATLTYQLPAVLPKKEPAVPSGTIVAYFSKQGAIPAGWTICDGTQGAPDLRNAFIMGVGTVAEVGSPGGKNEETATVANDVRLSIGGAPPGLSMMNAGGTGVINHTTLCPQCNLVNSYIPANTISVTFDNRPKYVGLIYLMKR